MQELAKTKELLGLPPEALMVNPVVLARACGVTDVSVRAWIREGKIQAIQLGRLYLIPVAEAARVLAAQTKPQPVND